MRPQRIVIAVPLEESQLVPFYEWGRTFDFTHVEAVHLLHVVQKNLTPLEFGLVESPDEFAYLEMVPDLEKFLRRQGEKIIPADYAGAITYEVHGAFNPEERVSEIVHQLRATLIVVATRGKHGWDGFLHNSFTDFMVKYSPCDVFVVRPPLEQGRTP